MNAVSLFLDRIATRLEGVSKDAIATTRSLFNICQARRYLPGVPDSAIAAACLCVALQRHRFPTNPADILAMHASVDRKFFDKAVKEVSSISLPSNSNSASSSSHLASIKSLCVKYSVDCIEKGIPDVFSIRQKLNEKSKAAQKLLNKYVSRNSITSEEQLSRMTVAIFFACARAANEKSIPEHELKSTWAIPNKYFRTAVATIQLEHSEELSAISASMAKVSANPSSTRKNAAQFSTKLAVPVASSVSSLSTNHMSTPNTRAMNMRTRNEFDDSDNDNKQEKKPADIIPALRTPSRHGQQSQQQILQLQPPLQQYASSPPTAKINDGIPERKQVTPSRAGRAVTPLSRNGTPVVSKSKRQREDDDDNNKIRLENSAIKPKKKQFIGRQSMINWEDDGETSKKCIAAAKWLADIRALTAQKLTEMNEKTSENDSDDEYEYVEVQKVIEVEVDSDGNEIIESAV
ncbi:hypothetical protein HK100_003493 [Physocladia obscura]|uniref:Uncharacterized protein n=1 Tax=Physocladia obscura TaxID=109957 RepID=A0AAD5SU80_9FUNG|nr:hypothetical protein HK100_003493 [Physocladia obscura]